MEGGGACSTTPSAPAVAPAPASLVHGTVAVLDATGEEWIEYTEHLENFFLPTTSQMRRRGS